MKYKVWDASELREGTAEEILEEIIHKDTAPDSEINQMSVDQYAQAIIRSADHYLPKQVVNILNVRLFPSDYDKALTLLASMPASGMAILASEPDRGEQYIREN